jgi:hypothetical protein
MKTLRSQTLILWPAYHRQFGIIILVSSEEKIYFQFSRHCGRYAITHIDSSMPQYPCIYLVEPRDMPFACYMSMS